MTGQGETRVDLARRMAATLVVYVLLVIVLRVVGVFPAHGSIGRWAALLVLAMGCAGGVNVAYTRLRRRHYQRRKSPPNG